MPSLSRMTFVQVFSPLYRRGPRDRILVLALMLAGATLALEADISAVSPELTQLRSCDFAVRFPGNVQVQEFFYPAPSGEIRAERALHKSARGAFRHECICADRLYLSAVPPQYVRKRLAVFAHLNGLSAVQLTPVQFAGATAIDMRGTKMIDGVPSTYLLRAVVTTECYVESLVASKATDFPPSGAPEFFQSLRRVAQATSAPEEWIKFHRMPTGAIRLIDVANLRAVGDTIEFKRKYISSFKSVVVHVSQIQCSTGRTRALHVEFWSPEADLEERTNYPTNTRFETADNDLTHRILFKVLCSSGTPQTREVVVEKLKTLPK